MSHARRKLAEIAGTDLPYEEFYQLVEERYAPYRDWALGENKETPCGRCTCCQKARKQK